MAKKKCKSKSKSNQMSLGGWLKEDSSGGEGYLKDLLKGGTNAVRQFGAGLSGEAFVPKYGKGDFNSKFGAITAGAIGAQANVIGKLAPMALDAFVAPGTGKILQGVGGGLYNPETLSSNVGNKAEEEAKYQQELAMRRSQGMQNTLGNNQSVFAMGGNLFKNELTSYTGPTHAQGGIQVDNGKEVEAGETRGIRDTKDFIFSDRLNFNNKTFADLSKDIEKKYKGNDDKMSIDAKNRELNLLAEVQEKQKVNKVGNKMTYGGKIWDKGEPWFHQQTYSGTKLQAAPYKTPVTNYAQANNVINTGSNTSTGTNNVLTNPVSNGKGIRATQNLTNPNPQWFGYMDEAERNRVKGLYKTKFQKDFNIDSGRPNDNTDMAGYYTYLPAHKAKMEELFEELKDTGLSTDAILKKGSFTMKGGKVVPAQEVLDIIRTNYAYSAVGGDGSTNNNGNEKLITGKGLQGFGSSGFKGIYDASQETIIPKTNQEKLDGFSTKMPTDWLGIVGSALPNMLAAGANQLLKKDVDYGRVAIGAYNAQENLLDPTRTVQSVNAAFNDAKGNIRESNVGRGNYLSNVIGSTTRQGEKLSDVYSNFGNANAQIKNQVSQFNANQASQADKVNQLTNQEINMNEVRDKIGLEQNSIELAKEGLNQGINTYLTDKRTGQYLAMAGGDNVSNGWYKGQPVKVVRDRGYVSVVLPDGTQKVLSGPDAEEVLATTNKGGGSKSPKSKTPNVKEESDPLSAWTNIGKNIKKK